MSGRLPLAVPALVLAVLGLIVLAPLDAGAKRRRPRCAAYHEQKGCKLPGKQYQYELKQRGKTLFITHYGKSWFYVALGGNQRCTGGSAKGKSGFPLADGPPVTGVRKTVRVGATYHVNGPQWFVQDDSHFPGSRKSDVRSGQTIKGTIHFVSAQKLVAKLHFTMSYPADSPGPYAGQSCSGDVNFTAKRVKEL